MFVFVEEAAEAVGHTRLQCRGGAGAGEQNGSSGPLPTALNRLQPG